MAYSTHRYKQCCTLHCFCICYLGLYIKSHRLYHGLHFLVFVMLLSTLLTIHFSILLVCALHFLYRIVFKHVRTLMCRAEALSSSGVSRVQEEKLVSQALQGNGYLKGFIHKHTCSQPDQWTPRDQVARGSVTLPYTSGLSESIRRVFPPLAIQVTFRPFRTLRQELVHPKDPVPANHRKGVMYSIPCAECPRTYIGQMGRSLDHSFHEQCQALKHGDLGSSALAAHVFSSNHRVDLSKAMVINTYNHTKTRCMLESWHIQHHQSIPNREKGTLPVLYAALLT